MKNCFRFGRISEPNLQEIVFKNELFRSLPSGQQSEMEQFINHVLHGETRNQTVIDGHGLLYAKPIFYFRPRETRQFLIAAGGWIEGRTTSSIELFDYQLNMWLSTPFKLPSVVSYFGFEAIDSTIYVFGGSNGREIFKELKGLNLSCKESKWQNKCSMIERRCYVSSVVLDGRIYAIGGFNQQRRIRKCEKYCPQLDCWTEIADLHYARSDASSATYGGRIFIAGGINDTNIEQSVEVYYPDGNYWLIVKSMATPRTSFAMTCYSDRIWAIGGNDGHRRLNSVESYDPVLNIWRQERPMINSRSTFRAISFNDELVVVGGYNGINYQFDQFCIYNYFHFHLGENPVRSVEKFNPKKGWLKVRPLLHERSGLSLITIPNNFDLFHHWFDNKFKLLPNRWLLSIEMVYNGVHFSMKAYLLMKQNKMLVFACISFDVCSIKQWTNVLLCFLLLSFDRTNRMENLIRHFQWIILVHSYVILAHWLCQWPFEHQQP